MCFANTLEKRILILFSFFLLSSCNQVANSWKESSVEGPREEYCSTRSHLPSSNHFSGIEFEVIAINGESFAFLNVRGLKLPEKELDFRVYIGDEEQIHEGYVLKGGHKIKLSLVTKDMIMQALEKNLEVRIVIGHYKTTLTGK